jgi:hypothetical protein
MKVFLSGSIFFLRCCEVLSSVKKESEDHKLDLQSMDLLVQEEKSSHIGLGAERPPSNEP